MDMIAQALARELRGVIDFNVKVVEIEQSDKSVTINSVDARSGQKRPPFKADWCVCTIPLSVLSQVKINVSDTMKSAISAVPYASAIKIGMQFKRRFWEDDEAIYGGITFTDLPNGQISYPSTNYLSSGKGVLLAAYMFGVNAIEFTAKSPEERARLALDYVSQIHPQARSEYDNAMSVAWHRMPATLGCFGVWNKDTRANHYKNLCAIDGRIVLAGEHCSYVNAWQEGAILSSLDAIARLHKRIVSGS
jgi:monoamine oxidase